MGAQTNAGRPKLPVRMGPRGAHSTGKMGPGGLVTIKMGPGALVTIKMGPGGGPIFRGAYFYMTPVTSTFFRYFILVS